MNICKAVANRSAAHHNGAGSDLSCDPIINLNTRGINHGRTKLRKTHEVRTALSLRPGPESSLAALIGSVYNAWVRALNHPHYGRGVAILLTLLSCCGVPAVRTSCRTFPLKVQDRAIRAEENLRHFAMTGKLLDPRLTIKQVIGLRFASDAEFVALAKRAADESMSLDAIKRAVKNWKIDSDRKGRPPGAIILEDDLPPGTHCEGRLVRRPAAAAHARPVDLAAGLLRIVGADPAATRPRIAG